MPARLRPWCRQGTPSQLRASATMRSGVIVSAGIGVAHHGVLSRHVRLAAELEDIGEAGDAGDEALVAAGMDAEHVADTDGVAHGQEELDLAGGLRPVLHLDGAAGVGATLPGEHAALEPAIDRTRLVDRGGEDGAIDDADDDTRTAPGLHRLEDGAAIRGLLADGRVVDGLS